MSAGPGGGARIRAEEPQRLIEANGGAGFPGSSSGALPPPPSPPPHRSLLDNQRVGCVATAGEGVGVHFGKWIFLWWKGAQTFANEVVTVRVAAAGGGGGGGRHVNTGGELWGNHRKTRLVSSPE